MTPKSKLSPRFSKSYFPLTNMAAFPESDAKDMRLTQDDGWRIVVNRKHGHIEVVNRKCPM